MPIINIKFISTFCLNSFEFQTRVKLKMINEFTLEYALFQSKAHFKK